MAGGAGQRVTRSAAGAAWGGKATGGKARRGEERGGAAKGGKRPGRWRGRLGGEGQGSWWGRAVGAVRPVRRQCAAATTTRPPTSGRGAACLEMRCHFGPRHTRPLNGPV